MRFGRLERRFEEARGERIIRVIEEMVGRPVPSELAAPLRHGANELDLVRSALDDTMRGAYTAMREALEQYRTVSDYRTAAFVVAIQKIARAYIEMGTA
jgi:glutamate dehydrogenase (NAD(P)+)